MTKNKITAVLGPTNTGKTHLAIETMLSFEIAFPINELVITNKTARDFNKFFIILSSQ